MEYLEKVIGIKVIYKEEKREHLPNYIKMRYELKIVSLDNVDCVFVYPKNELEEIKTLKQRINTIEEITKLNVVFVLKQITFRKREFFLKEKIAFIVENKQAYLPFMALYLQEKYEVGKKIVKKLSPSSQLLLLYFIYSKCEDLSLTKAAEQLQLTKMTISRSSRELEELGLVNIRKEGVQKVMYTENTCKELYKKAKNILLNPVKRTIYVSKDSINEKLCISGVNALSNYSMIAESNLKCYATNKITEWEGNQTTQLEDSTQQVALQLWRYDPKKLTKNKMVDRLSLALTFKDEMDERIEQCVEEMLEEVWRDLDGKRN